MDLPIGKQLPAGVTMNSAQVPLLMYFDEQATRRPIKMRGKMPAPAATTLPQPSMPGMKLTVSSAVISLILARSEGLTGAASILIKTSPLRGTGTSTFFVNNFPFSVFTNTAVICEGTGFFIQFFSGI
jgi:hypothetical protein